MKKSLGYALLAFVGISLAFAFFQEDRAGHEPQSIAAAPTDSSPEVHPKDSRAAKPAKAQAIAAKAATRSSATAAKQQSPRNLVIARYCHGHARCSNCIKIEQYSREAIETGLRKDLDSGRLRFEVVDVEEPANRHYIQDYALYTKSLVLISEADGKELRHKVLNDVWNHLSDKAAFMAYVKSETEGFLK